jgi:hypothetical protein
MKTKFLLLASLLVLGISCKKDKPLTAPQTGLISYFNFDENLKDQKGYASDGVFTGNPSWTVGKIGKCVTYDGVNDVLEFTPTTPIGNGKISLSCWVKTAEAGNVKYFISGNGFGLATTASKVSMVISAPNTSSAISNPITANEWTHVVGTFDGTNIQIFINGSWVASTNNPGNMGGFNSVLKLAKVNGIYWAGSIDELYIYNRALSPAEVTQLYNLK